MNFRFLYSLLLFFCCFLGHSQDSIRITIGTNSGVNVAADKLTKSLNKNQNDTQIAKEYENLSRELIKKGEYAKAEEYLIKARDLYSKNKKKKEVASVSRELARIQESRNDLKNAISNYDAASRNTTDPALKQFNINDANRLRNASNPEAQSNYIQQNISLAGQLNLNEEKANSYQQLAEINLQTNQKDMALVNLEKALENSKDKTTEIKRQIANVYASDNQLEKAIKINKDLIEDARKSKDSKKEIEQLQLLSDIYLSDNQDAQSISLLEEAYRIALTQGQTSEAKISLEKLTEIYQRQGDYNKSIQLYKNFLSNLEQLIKSDSSLVDIKLFELSEDKINQLEKEKALQEELINKKNLVTYFLVAILIIIAFFSFFLIRILYSIKKKNKEIALQSLRREMNPHFIFNSLNSVNQFIAQNNELEANKYLTSYSKLMRNIMENSNKDFIKLSQELDQLHEYLDLEQLRFQDKFSYLIQVDEIIDTEAIYIPNMIVQPNLENAIWHGLRYRKEKGILKLSLKQNGTQIVITIEDDGIGLKESHRIKTENQKLHKSKGLSNTQDRINLLNDLYKTNIQYTVTEKEQPETGVIVTLIFPNKPTENL